MIHVIEGIWLAVDKDGDETAFYCKPVPEFEEEDEDDENWWVPDMSSASTSKLMLPHGTIEKILGYKVTWKTSPVFLPWN